MQTNRSPLHFSVSDQPLTTLFHQDEALLTQEKGGTVRSWQLGNSGYEKGSIINNQHCGFCRMECVPEENILISPKDTNKIVIYDLDNLETLHATLDPSDLPEAPTLGQIMCFKYINLSSNPYLLACYESGDFLTWDLRSSKVIDHKKYEECPMAVDYDASSNRGIYGGPSEMLGVFSYAKNSSQLMRTSEISVKNPGINCVNIRRDQKVFSTGGWDGRIRIFSWKSLRLLAVLTEHKAAVTDISYSNEKVSMWNASIMATAGLDSQISLWDLYN